MIIGGISVFVAAQGETMSIENVEVKRMKELNDGCADVYCIKHGFLARVIVNIAEVLCQKCGRWIRAVPDKNRLKAERRRARNQRYRSRQSTASQSVQQV